MGLSTAHTEALDCQEDSPCLLEMRPHGALARVSRYRPWRGNALGGGTRGVVRRFTKGSRSRLQRRVGSLRVDRVERCLFVTLTYHTWPGDSALWKRHLGAFRRSLVRAYPGCSAIWRMEAQQRGAPHFHLLLFGVDFLPIPWLDAHWPHGMTNIGRPHDYAAGVNYVSKYVGKEQDTPYRDMDGEVIECPGRQWGVINAPCLPEASVVREVISTLTEWDRTIRELCGWSGREWDRWWPLDCSATFFGSGPPPLCAKVGE